MCQLPAVSKGSRAGFRALTYVRDTDTKEGITMSDPKEAKVAGYSGTPLAKKLGIKEGFSILAIDPPNNYLELLGPLPENVSIESGTAIHTSFDLIHMFRNSRHELFRQLAECVRLIKQNGTIWVSWYKKAAKLPTEITEDTIREAAFPLGLVDVKVCAVDEKWSGLKLVIRKENRSQ